MEFSNCNLHEKLISGVASAGYVTCTPVQEQVLHAGRTGSDLYVQSQTGTGKTAAYMVLMLERMLSQKDDSSIRKQALVLVPTRELAVQVEKEARLLAQATDIRAASFYGGVGYQQQEKALQQGVDIIIGTPGRIIDLQKSGTMQLDAVGFLVIDEADRMFDMGFYPDLRILLGVVPQAEQRQTMLFSATLNSWVKNLAWEYTKDAQEIVIDADTVTVNEINQQLFHVAGDKKMALLLGLLQKNKADSCIIFCNTKKTVEIVAKRLQKNGFKTDYLIGDLPQQKRLRLIESFKAGRLHCLVATDVAARGLDITDLKMVINYDLPVEAENYVHRIGRTARAGKTGTAYSLCSEQDVYNLPAIEKYIEIKIPALIPTDSDFAEDASSGLYIRLDNQKDRGREKQKRSSTLSHNAIAAAKKSESKVKNRKRKNTHESTNRENTRKTVANLQDLTFEQRMAYYKEHYASHLAYSIGENGNAPAVGVNKTVDTTHTMPNTQGQKKHRKRRVRKNPEKKHAVVHNQSLQKTTEQPVEHAEDKKLQKKDTFLTKITRFFKETLRVEKN